MGMISDDPFFSTFDIGRGSVVYWWRRADIWRQRRGVPAITSLELLLAALEGEAKADFCRFYYGPRVSFEIVLRAYDALPPTVSMNAASQALPGPLDLQVSGDLKRILDRYHTLHSAHGQDDYATPEWLFFYAMFSCEDTLIARIADALGVDRHGANLLLRDRVFCSRWPRNNAPRLETLIPLDRPYFEFICPPELRSDDLPPEQWRARCEAWQLRYVKDQVQRHFMPIPASPPLPGMVAHLIDGDFEDVVAYDDQSRQWWSLIHSEPRVIKSYPGESVTYYLPRPT